MFDPSLTILVTGASGMLGSNLVSLYQPHCNVVGTYLTHPLRFCSAEIRRCDLLDEHALTAVFDQFRPDVVIHCVAMTNVDGCEANPAQAEACNIEATRRVARHCKSHATKLVYISTDAVYACQSGPARESDSTVPVNYYGKTKLAGEEEARQVPDALILRTTIVGWNAVERKGLVEWLLAEAGQEKSIGGFTDSLFTPMYTMHLGRVIEQCICDDITGTYNCGSIGSVSKYEFARSLLKAFGFSPDLVIPASIADHSFVAPRGRDCRLDCSALASRVILPDLEQCFQGMKQDADGGLRSRLRQASAADR